jgi:hypothetical protein
VIRGVFLSATRSFPPTEKEYEPLADLLTGSPSETVIADKGIVGSRLSRATGGGGD